jgi:hypothetical protein
VEAQLNNELELFELDQAYAPTITSSIDFIKKVCIVEAAADLHAQYK